MSSLTTVGAGPSAATDPYADYLVYDKFTDDDATALTSHTPEKDAEAGGWAVGESAYIITSNKVVAPTAAGRQYAYIDSGQAAVLVSGSVIAPSGLIARLSDATHCLFLCVLAGATDELRIYKDDAAFTSLAGTAHDYTNGVEYNVTFDCDGNDLVGTENGTSVSITNTFNNTQTSCGLWNNSPDGSQIHDDFTVEAS